MKLSKAEFEALIEASQRTFVSFSQLVLSVDYQARSSGSGPRLSIPELAASIKECGVLQNLIVVQAARHTYEVCAGGRRLEALTALVAAGELPENFPVPVLIVEADRGLLVSLAENAFHLPMHPADEFEAFAKLVARGKPVEDVAAAFGVTPMVVKRRMKLAAVSPRLMAQFRAGSINLECLMVLASVEHHERQEQAWAALDSWNRHPDHLRRILTQGEVESDRSPVARYVTVKAYEKAGGPTRRDLFSDSDRKVYLLDAALLDQLAVGKLQGTANKIAAEGWKWVDVRPRHVHDEYVRHGELRKSSREPSEQEAAALHALNVQLEENKQRLNALYAQDGSDEETEAECARLEALREELSGQVAALEEVLAIWPPELMAEAGCIVYVGNDAKPAVRYGLIRPDDRSNVLQANRGGVFGGAASRSGLAAVPEPKTRPVHSEKLVRNLTAHRVAAIQAELLDRSDVALAVLTAQMAKSLLLDDYRQAYGCEDPLKLTVTDTHHSLRADALDIEASKAWQILNAKRSYWQSILPPQAADMLPWVLTQEPDSVRQLFTFLVAITVTGVYATEPAQQRTDGLAQALRLDMTHWWQASGPSYFQHVSKARATEVVSEATGAPAGKAMQALKKEAAVAHAAQAVAGTGWLPTVLRLRPPADVPDADVALGPDDDPPLDVGESDGDTETAGN